MDKLDEIAKHCVTSGAQLIVDGGFVIAVARVGDDGEDKIDISPVLDNVESARQFSKVLENESVKRNRPDVLSLGVFKIQSISEIKI